jgi:serine/threonine-protein kinase
MNAREPGRDELERWLGATVGGKYRVERLLGRGGMGAVFAAQNTAIGKRVALKFLSAEAARDRDATRRFQREARAASLVESEHIVQVFDAGATDDGVPFLVMEQLTGEDLRARLAREPLLPLATAAEIASQVLRALVRAHAAGIVHRDLKPDNVFLSTRDDGSLLVKIVDFGISKLDRGTLGERLTRRGSVLGSAYYMAPEQAQASDSVDRRSDLYGVGALLFEMLAGRPPHLGPTLESVLVAICTHTAPDVRSLRPEVPAELARAIARALEREPDARFASAQDFLAALDGSAPAAESARDPTRAHRRPSPTAVAGVVAALAGFALTAIVVSTRARGPKPAVLDAPVASTAPAPLVTPGAAFVTVTALGPTASSSSAAATLVPSIPPSASAHPAPAPPNASVPAAHRTVEHKRAAAPANRGVASSLQLSTREP